MSKFSGKCDFCDEIDIFGLENILKSKVYIGSSDIPLVLRNRKDCIPYYPYIVVGSVTEHGIGTIRLSNRSWVDIEEERYGHMTMHDHYRNELKKEMEKAEYGESQNNF